MIKIEFTEGDIQALNYERYHHPHPRVQRKMEALWLKSQGEPHNKIAQLTGISINVVTQYIKEYKAGGIEKLKELNFYRVTFILDNASYQRCTTVNTLAAQLNLELIFLPPYSPNLNLIERLWKFVKKQCLYSKYYSEFANFKNAITDCLQKTHSNYKRELDSLLTLNFQTFNKSHFVNL